MTVKELITQLLDEDLDSSIYAAWTVNSVSSEPLTGLEIDGILPSHIEIKGIPKGSVILDVEPM